MVGHAKTCLVLAGGYLFFPMTGTMQQLYNNIMGVSVAMVGVVLYGHVKHASGQNEVRRASAMAAPDRSAPAQRGRAPRAFPSVRAHCSMPIARPWRPLLPLI